MVTNCDKLLNSIQHAKNVQLVKNSNITYNFKLYPFGERGTYIEPGLIREITDNLCQSIQVNFSEYDYFVSPEPGGHTWGMLTSYQTQKPINILRMSVEKYQEFEISILRETAYNENYIYFDAFKKGDQVIILDDVISSGATVRAIANQLAKMEVKIAGVQVILVKGDNYKKLEQEYGFPVHFLAKV